MSDGAAGLDGRIEAARRGVAAWRAVRRRGTRMPERLWTEAVWLAARLGVSAVARRLEIGHQTLEERLSAERHRPGTSSHAITPVKFVEMTGAALTSAALTSAPTPAPPLPGPAGVVIELTRQDGAQMVVRLDVAASVDVAHLVHAFWGRSL